MSDPLNQNPEQRARDTIDAQLQASGWAVQDKTEINFNECEGQAIREYSTDAGPADYVLFVDKKPVAVIEAKREDAGLKLTGVEEQTGKYASAKLKWVQKTGGPLPFLYEATGVITRFTDQRDPKPRSREIFTFHRPETLSEWVAQGCSLRQRLPDIPTLKPDGLRICQVNAIGNLDTSLSDARPRALVQMATGSGKTYTAITAIYRLLKFAKAKRILFLVDTCNLGEQAEQEFMAYTPNDDNRKFTELYTVQRLSSSHVPKDAQVCISTIQRMYSILQGKELDASDEQDKDEAYSSKKLDTDIVTPSQIRTVIQTFRDKLPEIFPNRIDEDGSHEVPKTLIFAKNDSHADDIIQIVREVFAESNSFCKKLTYKTKDGLTNKDGDVLQEAEDPKSVLSQFRNDYYPRIAVTVDMIATGTDVKPLECLLFMRDVKSKGYFEQMKGRGTRTLDHDKLKKTSRTAKSAKTHYVIIDAIGVTKSIKTTSRPPITKPSVAFKDLAMEVVMGSSDTDTVSSLAGRLARIERQLSDEQKSEIAEKSGGVPLNTIIKDLFSSIDGDVIQAKALEIVDLPAGSDPGDTAREKAQEELVATAAAPLTGAIVNLIIDTCKANMQTIDAASIDTLLKAEWDAEARDNADQMADEFATFLKDHKDELTALTLFYDQPQRRQEVTLSQIKEVMAKIQSTAPKLAPLRVWDAYSRLDGLPANAHPLTELTALVALIRRVCGIDEKLMPFNDTVRRNFRDWIMRKNAGNPEPLTEDQHAWLKLIRDHIATSFQFERDDLEYAPFDAQGGLGKMHQLFGDQMDTVIKEPNESLVA